MYVYIGAFVVGFIMAGSFRKNYYKNTAYDVLKNMGKINGKFFSKKFTINSKVLRKLVEDVCGKTD